MEQTLSYVAGRNANTRNTFLPLITALMLTLVFFSCKKDKEELPPPETTYHLNVSTNTVQSGATAGTAAKVGIDANADWKVTLPTGTDWLEVNKTTGAGDDSIQVKVIKENNTGVKRTATINVTLVNGKAPAKQITVEQDFISVNPVTMGWKKILGGNGNDYGYSIIKSADGGYLLSGRTTSNNGDITDVKGGIDMWVAKLDAAGSLTWQKSYGGNADEYSVASVTTPDGGYVLTGFTLSSNNGDVGANHGSTDFWVIKIDGNGSLQWQKTLGGTGDDRPYAVAVTTEGRIGVAGYTTSNNSGDVGANHGSQDMWVLLLDNVNGNILAKQTFGGNGDEAAKALAPAPDGGLFIGGNASSNNNGDVGATKGSSDFWILQVDKTLSILWKSSYGGTNIEELNTLAVGPANTLVAAGSTRSVYNGDVGGGNGGDDVWVMQLNAPTGTLRWQKVYGGDNGDVAKAVLVKSNGTIVLAGYTYSNNNGDVEANHGAGDFWILGLNNAGGLAWQKTLGGSNEELAYAIAESADGFTVAGATMSKNSGDVVGGYANSDIWLVNLKD